MPFIKSGEEKFKLAQRPSLARFLIYRGKKNDTRVKEKKIARFSSCPPPRLLQAQVSCSEQTFVRRLFSSLALGRMESQNFRDKWLALFAVFSSRDNRVLASSAPCFSCSQVSLYRIPLLSFFFISVSGDVYRGGFRVATWLMIRAIVVCYCINLILSRVVGFGWFLVEKDLWFWMNFLYGRSVLMWEG